MYCISVLFVFQCLLYTPHLIGRTFYGLRNADVSRCYLNPSRWYTSTNVILNTNTYVNIKEFALGTITDTIPTIWSANDCATDRCGRKGSSSASNSGVPSFICISECQLWWHSSWCRRPPTISSIKVPEPEWHQDLIPSQPSRIVFS